MLQMRTLIHDDAQVVAERAKTNPQPRADAYFQLLFRETPVIIHKPDFWVNGTQILRAAGVHRDKAVALLTSDFPYDDDIVVGGATTQGTYVDFETGLQLCRDNSLGGLADLLKALLAAYKQYLQELNCPTRHLPNLVTTTPQHSVSLHPRIALLVLRMPYLPKRTTP